MSDDSTAGGIAVPDEPGRIRAAMEKAINHALALQMPVATRLSGQMGFGDPEVAPKDAIKRLEAHYRTTVVALGAAAGMSAFLPGVGTVAGVAVNVGELGAYFEATLVYCLALAHFHGVEVTDLDRRRLLLFGMLLGEGGSQTIAEMAGRIGKHWGKAATGAIPASTVRAINRKLAHNLITKQGTKQGLLVLGRDLPIGIGAGVGAGGNWLLARGAIKASRAAFGPPPKQWPTHTATS